jgi:hypothetical protein
MSTWSELKRKVREGLYVNNLQELLTICLVLLEQPSSKSALCIMLLGIFRDLLELWYEVPLDGQKAVEVEKILIPAIIEAIDKRPSIHQLNQLAATYIQVRKTAIEAIRR